MELLDTERSSGDEFRCGDYNSETQSRLDSKLDVQDGGEVKRHVAECRLVETG